MASRSGLPQIMRKSGYNLGDSLLFLAVFSFTSAIGGIVLGQWADRFGVKRTVALAYALGAIGNPRRSPSRDRSG